MKGCIFVSFRYLDTDNITKSWLKMYLRTKYRYKLGWFFLIGLIQVTICATLNLFKKIIMDFRVVGITRAMIFHPNVRCPSKKRKVSMSPSSSPSTSTSAFRVTHSIICVLSSPIRLSERAEPIPAAATDRDRRCRMCRRGYRDYCPTPQDTSLRFYQVLQ